MLGDHDAQLTALDLALVGALHRTLDLIDIALAPRQGRLPGPLESAHLVLLAGQLASATLRQRLGKER